jgi:hypothetical protein
MMLHDAKCRNALPPAHMDPDCIDIIVVRIGHYTIPASCFGGQRTLLGNPPIFKAAQK